MTTKPIGKLLIANRGEIACRIMRTAREMGVATVAVYSDADAKALHTRSADEAVHIGPSPAAESYLVGEKIIAAAKETGADAIHPGYGFLSENADFARAVIDAGLIWVGPKPESIEAMGLKDAAKERMIAAGVPVTPGYLGEDQSLERLAKEAEAIGYPVLIKAVAGGGGKGMRKVDAPENFAADLESCQREAKASFGNTQVLLEKWITSPRHIEVQVFGDAHGNVVHLFERDCSPQRRHQKVIEEAPAPGMDETTREEICAAAVRAAKAVDYEGAGTIEFIADASDGLRADRIFFMEMNTRLQVEHPVTEEITGVDLVEWQICIASGHQIPLSQEELSINGHAIEARLYAEDPIDFLPSTGPLKIYRPHFERARIETGYEEGDKVTGFYDPMIEKIVAHRDSRSEAAQAVADICKRIDVWPVQTNAAFLWRALEHSEFLSGDVTTGFIERHKADLQPPREPEEEVFWAGSVAIAASEWQNRRHDLVDDRLELVSSGPAQPWREAWGFRLNSSIERGIPVRVNGQSETVELSDSWKRSELYAERVAGGWAIPRSGRWFFAEYDRHEGGGHASAAGGAILAPMPGKVIAVDIADGDTVTAGQRLMVLEAMKMEHALTAPFDGTVTELSVSEGGQVQVEAVLCVVEPQEDT